MLDRNFQALLLSTGSLAFGCYGANYNNSALGSMRTGNVSVVPESRVIKSGYPAKPVDVVLSKVSCTAALEFEEFGTDVAGLLTNIFSVLNGTEMSLTPAALSLSVFRPAGNDINVSIPKAMLLPQFSISLNEDIAAASFTFEAATSAATDGADALIAFTNGGAANALAPQLTSADNLSIGKPRITVGGVSIGCYESASLELTSNLKKVELGYPALTHKIFLLDYELSLSVRSEEFASSDLNPPTGDLASSAVTVIFPLVDGTSKTVDLGTCKVLPVANTTFNSLEFSTAERRYISTGGTPSIS